MKVDIQPFGEGGSMLYTLQGKGGAVLSVTNWGASVVRLLVPDRAGALRDVVLGYEDAEKYQSNRSAHGATVGRCANRIGGACFCWRGITYRLPANEGENVLHGGRDSYFRRLWRTAGVDGDANAVTFALHSPDGDQGMPGTADITVTYSLEEDNGVRIQYHAVADKDTVFNLTNHSYFNLDGHDAGPVYEHILWLDCASFAPVDGASIPTGELRPVAGTPFDFTSPKPLGRDMAAQDEQILAGNGYDHSFALNAPGLERPFAHVWSERSGIEMWAYTDLPAVQFYTGNNMGRDRGGKAGASYQKHGAFCLETQYHPDTPNKPAFPSNLFAAGTAFESTTVYRFSTI